MSREIKQEQSTRSLRTCNTEEEVIKLGGRSIGLVDKTLGKGSTRSVLLEFDSRSVTFEAKSFSFLTSNAPQEYSFQLPAPVLNSNKMPDHRRTILLHHSG